MGPRDDAFEHLPTTDQPFENALANARAGRRLSVEDAVELSALVEDPLPRTEPTRSAE